MGSLRAVMVQPWREILLLALWVGTAVDSMLSSCWNAIQLLVADTSRLMRASEMSGSKVDTRAEQSRCEKFYEVVVEEGKPTSEFLSSCGLVNTHFHAHFTSTMSQPNQKSVRVETSHTDMIVSCSFPRPKRDHFELINRTSKFKTARRTTRLLREEARNC